MQFTGSGIVLPLLLLKLRFILASFFCGAQSASGLQPPNAVQQGERLLSGGLAAVPMRIKTPPGTAENGGSGFLTLVYGCDQKS